MREAGDSGAFRRAVRDRPVVLLSATEVEATPVLSGLARRKSCSHATKTFYLGEVDLGREVDLEPLLPARGGRAGAQVRVVLAVTGCDKANVAHALTCLLENMVPEPWLVLQVGIAGGFPAGAHPSRVGDIVLATHEAYSDTGSSSPAGWLSAVELGLPIARVDGVESGGRFPLDSDLVGAAAAVIRETDWSGGDPAGGERWGGKPPSGEPAGVRPAGVSRPEDSAVRKAWAPPAILTGPCVTASRVTGLRTEADALSARWGALAESMEGAAAAHICALYGVPFLEVRGISNLVGDRERASWQVERAAATAGRAALAVVTALDRLPLN